MKHEQEFNHLLARALRSANPAWRTALKVEESRTLKDAAADRVDILIIGDDTPPVAIETSYKRGDADADAVARLGYHYQKTMMEIRTAIAVELDESCRHLTKIDKRRPFNYAIHQKIPGGTRRFPSKGFMCGTYLDLARLAASAPIPKEDMEKVATDVADNVKAAANLLKDAIPINQLENVSQTMYQRSALSGLRTTALLWLNAMLVQRMLIGGVHNIPPLTTNPTDCSYAWKKIREINWRAIFEPAIRILDGVSSISPGQATRALELLKKAVEIIEGARMGSGMSIGAELFPLLAEDRKESAAFYTQAPAAEFLAAMTIKRDAASWMDTSLFDKFKVVDLSCGTGTLLRYAYRQIRMYHEQAGGSVKTLEALHQKALERGLCGADVSPIASHMTSTSLAVMSKQPYDKTNIGWVGVGDGDRTGSIEYLKASAISDLLAAGFGISAGQDSGDDKGGSGSSDAWSGVETPTSVVAKDDDASIIIMNPPYSRTRGGQSTFDIAGLSDAERNACQKRWGKLIRGEPCIKTAGMAATFLCMAHRKAKAGGRIGFVLPRTAAFAKSWALTREMVETCFEDVTVVAVAAGRALGRTALSADTNMEEIFLIATKRDKPGKDHSPVRCVTLHEPLTRVGEAAEVARVVQTSSGVGAMVLGDSEVGISHMFRTSDGRPWSAVGSLSDALEMIKNGLLCGRLLDTEGDQVSTFEMTTIGDLFEVGPTHDLIGHLQDKDPRGAFTFTPVTSNADAVGKYRAMWKSVGSKQKNLLAMPTHKGIEHDAKKTGPMWKKRTTLFYQKNMTWSSQAMVAVMTRRGVMGGSAWVGLKHDDERVMKAFALWANSIFGMVVYWANGQRSQQDARSRMQIGAVKKVQCPNFTLFSDDALNEAAKIFDEMAGLQKPLERYEKSIRQGNGQNNGGEMAYAEPLSLLPAHQSVDDTSRSKISAIMAEMLSAPDYDYDELTRLWCAEPSVMKRTRSKARRKTVNRT